MILVLSNISVRFRAMRLPVALIEALRRTGSCIKSPSLVASALVVLPVFIAVRLWLTVALA